MRNRNNKKEMNKKRAKEIKIIRIIGISSIVFGAVMHLFSAALILCALKGIQQVDFFWKGWDYADSIAIAHTATPMVLANVCALLVQASGIMFIFEAKKDERREIE